MRPPPERVRETWSRLSAGARVGKGSGERFGERRFVEPLLGNAPLAAAALGLAIAIAIVIVATLGGFGFEPSHAAGVAFAKP